MDENPYQAPAVESEHPPREVKSAELQRLALRTSAISIGLHFLLWLIMVFAPEAFRPWYFGFHLPVIFLLYLIGAVPSELSLGFFILGIPVAGALIHTLVISCGGSIGGRIAFRRKARSLKAYVVRGALVAFAMIAVTSAITAIIVKVSGFRFW